jgi:hypothetical protein
MKFLVGMKNLNRLSAKRSGIDDEGLAAIGKLTELEILGLNECPITDSGLTHLTGLKKLTWLGLYKTKVTEAGVKNLKKDLTKMSANIGMGQIIR